MTEQRLERWEGAAADALAEEWNAPRVHLFQRVGSTNDVARRLAEQGAPSGTVVLAEQQTAGRGRVGRAWVSPPKLGVWLSVVLRTPPVADPTLLPLIIGVLAARSLERFVHPLRPQVKWPNDLLLNGRKLGGILCEAVWSESSPAFVLAGIGVNVLHTADDFPPEIRMTATSLGVEGYAGALRKDVAAGMVRAATAAVSPEGAAVAGRLPTEMESVDALRGKPVTIFGDDAKAPAVGIAMGVSPDGALLIHTPAGVLRAIRSGSVRVLAEGSALPDSIFGADESAVRGAPLPN
jgi:BirA family biotin operon repressor/biotin-[acetyl-CoA-carboxylase] ligase